MGATTTTVVTTVLGCGVVALLVVLVVVRRRATAERVQRERLEAELARARSDVAALGRRLDGIGHDVLEAQQTAERAEARSAELTSRPEREFVITSLGTPQPDAPGATSFALPRPASMLEERLVQAASRHAGSSSGAAATRLFVAATAVGHGVRRALSPEVLDRAAAEATVARRRSRRDRRRDLREARRVLRTVQERPSGKHVA
jgi:hypothetical protein